MFESYQNVRYLANSYLKQIFDFRQLPDEYERNFNLLERFDVAVNTLQKLKVPDLSDFILFICLSKLNAETFKAFAMHKKY